MIEYELIRSKRKTIALSITGGFDVLVRAPLRMPIEDIESFINKHSAWIKKHMSRINERSQKMKRLSFTTSLNTDLKKKAMEYLPQRAAYIGGIMGATPAGIKITSARTRWGSCSGKNSICFSYRVMLLPEDLIDYIIVHELTHIRIKNHSSTFYRELAKYMPDYRERIKKLRQINVSREYIEFPDTYE